MPILMDFVVYPPSVVRHPSNKYYTIHPLIKSLSKYKSSKNNYGIIRMLSSIRPRVFQQQFQMSSIKSHLSILSRQPEQHKNSSKLTTQTMASNPSSSFLHNFGSIQNTSVEIPKGFNNSFEKGSNNQMTIEQEERQSNSGNISISQIDWILQYAQAIAFQANQCQEKKAYIGNKIRVIRDLQLKVSIMEEKVKNQVRSYTSKEKTLKSRSLSLSKHRKKISQRVQTEIYDMKVEIDWMKRTISSNKRNYCPRNSSSIAEKPKKQRVYIPMPYTNQRHYHHDVTHRESRISEYLPHNHNREQYAERNHINTEQFLSHRQKDYSISFWNQNNRHQHSISSKRTSNNEIRAQNGASYNKERRGEATGGILDLIQQKLHKANKNDKGNRPRHKQAQRNPEIPHESQSKELGLISKDSVNLHININNEPNLEYLQDENLEIRSSQKSKKSIKTLKSSRGLVNKWKKDQEDKEIVQLLRKSIEEKFKNKNGYGRGQRSSIGAKLIITDNGNRNGQFSANINTKSKEKLGLLDDSEQRKHNNSESSDTKKIREGLANSFIGIDLHDISDSQDEYQGKEHKNKSGIKNFNSTAKKQIKNQEQSHPYTPPNNEPNRLQPPKLLTPTNSTFQKSYQHALTKPPSIMQQGQDEYYDDDMDSIKLATTSKRFDYQTPSKLITKSQMKSQDQDEDFLGGIRLQTTSKISRERQSKLSNSAEQRIQQFLQVPSGINTIAYSQLSPSVNDEELSMDDIQSELRKSTNSNFVKKGSSAIQKSVNRNQKSHIEQPNRHSYPSKSTSLLLSKNGVANTIQEADEEEEEYSTIVRKVKRTNDTAK